MAVDTDEAFRRLSARVTAMTMLLKMLLVDDLDRAPDPAKAVDLMRGDHYARTESKSLAEVGGTMPLMITEELDASMDRVLARVLDRRRRRSPG